MMEKSLQPPVINPTSSSSPPRNTSTTASIASNPLKALNKSSYKISKPPSRNPNPNPFRSSSPPPPPPPLPPPPNSGGGTQPPQPQPPVYNIDKDDFRDVVQKLTGSPAHHRPSPPPPLSSTATTGNRLPISRLHRIRPPPLAQLLPSPPPPSAAPGEGWTRPPLSPLPPLPAVSAAAESPITAYMRRLRGGGSPAISPPSPLGFGCVPPMMSMMMPTSPVPPMSSPKWGDT